MHLFRPGTALHLFTLLISHGESWLKRAICLMKVSSNNCQMRASTRSVVVSGICTTLIAFMSLTASQSSFADEPHAQFLEGLRSRGFFDTALEHLETLRTRGDIPKAFADTLDLERGITYREMGTASRIPEDREQALGQAELALKKFTSEHGDHPRAAFANFELGQLLLERARSILWDSESPSNVDRKKEMQQEARTLIEQGKVIYQKAHDQYNALYKSFPTFIDQEEEPEQFDERQAMLGKYLRAWYNLARCTYERGQTFDKGSAERKETLERASKQFEEIHEANRSVFIGRLSRLMMGKCFQENDDIPRALGLYNEIKDDKSENASAMLLKAYAIQFRLICLNHEKKQDYQLVINEATAWMENKLNRRQLFTEQGLGILWERAIAEENLAKAREIDAKQRTAILRQALADSKQVARFPSPYREPSVAMSRRINAQLGEKDEEPKDFDTAFERGRGMITELTKLKDDLDKAKTAEDKQKARQAMSLQLNEIGRMLELALSLRDEESDAKAAASARYLLSYIYLRQRKSLDAIILAKYCMTTDRLNDPDSALSATEIAIEAAVQAYNDAGEDQQFELHLLKDVCELIISQYAQSSKGNEARKRLGQVYRDLNQPLKAAETFLTVPKEYTGYASARMQAGQSYWLAWVRAVAEKQNAEQPEDDTATLDQWKQEAAKLLTEGLTVARTKLGQEPPPTPEMAAAEVSLATIMNMDSKFGETVKRLTAGGKSSVISLLEVAQNETRPAKGIKSRPFASQTYRLLLRAYIGTREVDKALETMSKLESVGGQDMAAVYTELGRELEQELQRLKSNGDDAALTQARADFEAFLKKVYEQRDASDYNSLLWIGETYFGLGQGVIDDPVVAPDYFQRASKAYEEILENNLVEGPTVTAIKLRIVRSKRALKDFETAIAVAQEVLDETPLSLDVQFEAAYTLSDWGADETNGQPDKLLQAIDGLENAGGEKSIWGWSGITRKLQARQTSPDWPDFKDRFLEARYEYIRSRYRYGKTGAAEGEKQLRSALGEITIFAQVFHDLDDSWFSKFDRLYQNVQTELGEAPVALERPEPPEIPPEELNPEPQVAEDETKPEGTPETTEEAPAEGPNVLLISLAVALAAGGAFAFYKVMSKPPQRRKTFAAAGDSVAPPMGDGPVPAADAPPDFGNLGNIEAPSAAIGIAPPAKKKVARKKVKKAATASGAAPSAGAPGAKKKRVLTPEEAAKYRAAKAAKAKAAAAQANLTDAQKEALRKKKAAKKAAQGERSASAGTAKKKLKKRPPPPSE